MSEKNTSPAIWWEVNWSYGISIAPRVVAKETAATVFVIEANHRGIDRQYAYRKESSGTTYFRTWDEAHAFALDKAEKKLVAARSGLQRAQSMHGNIKGMEMPDLSKLDAILQRHGAAA